LAAAKAKAAAEVKAAAKAKAAPPPPSPPPKKAALSKLKSAGKKVVLAQKAVREVSSVSRTLTLNP